MSDAQEIKPGRGGFRPGAGRPKGAKTSRSKTQQERDTLAALRIEQLLDEAREGKTTLTPDRLKAIELRYSRLRPMLSSVEQTVHDQRDTADPNELARRLASIFEAKPELFEQVQAIRAAASAQQQAPEQADQRVTH